MRFNAYTRACPIERLGLTNEWIVAASYRPAQNQHNCILFIPHYLLNNYSMLKSKTLTMNVNECIIGYRDARSRWNKIELENGPSRLPPAAISTWANGRHDGPALKYHPALSNFYPPSTFSIKEQKEMKKGNAATSERRSRRRRKRIKKELTQNVSMWMLHPSQRITQPISCLFNSNSTQSTRRLSV